MVNRSQFQFNLYEKIHSVLNEDNQIQDLNRGILYDYQYISYLYITGQIVPKKEVPRGILLMYQMGAGKTMPSIAIAMKLAYQGVQFKGKDGKDQSLRKQILVICNASVRENYKKELQKYVDLYEKEIKKKYGELIDFDPYNKNNTNEDAMYLRWMRGKIKYVDFITLNEGRLYTRLLEKFGGKTLENHVVVVDEAHNFFNAIVNDSTGKSELQRILMESKDTNLVFLSGTPMINDPFEIVPCINMIAGHNVVTNDYIVFTNNYYTSDDISSRTLGLKNKWDLQNRCIGLVSFSSGDQRNFPELKPASLIPVQMDGKQLQAYILAKKQEQEAAAGGGIELDIQQDFQSQQQQTNITGGGPGFLKIDLWSTDRKMRLDASGSVHTKSRQYGNGFRDEEESISPKADLIVDFIKANKGIHFVYSQFIENGLNFVKERLIKLGLQDLMSSQQQEGKQYFASITGQIDDEGKKKILGIMNARENKNGDIVRVIMGSSAAAEGINFKNIKYVHIMEPYWNYGRLKQTIARARRNNSHMDLDESERYVQPLIYIATPKGFNDISSDIPRLEESVDKYVYNLAMKKEKLIDEMIRVLRGISINCSHTENETPDPVDCVMCQNFGDKLYDERNVGSLPQQNPCMRRQLQQFLDTKEQSILHNGHKYIVINVKPLPGDLISGKQVYRYSEKLKEFIRVTGMLQIEILAALKKAQ